MDINNWRLLLQCELSSLLLQISIYAIKKYAANIKDMSEITAHEEMRENSLDNKHVPYKRLKDTSMERSQITPVTSSAGVRFFSHLNFTREIFRLPWLKKYQSLFLDWTALNSCFFSFVKICSGWKSSPFQEERQRIIDSDWGGYALDLDLWEDSKSPVVQVRPGEVSLDDKESSGFLSDRLIGIGSSFLTKSSENGLYILSKCILKNIKINKYCRKFHLY